MNAKHLMMSVAMLAVTGAAVAGNNAGSVESRHNIPTKSRAEVRAEFDKARAAGAFIGYGELIDASTPASTLSRAEVRAELAKARAAGELVNYGDVVSFPQPVLTRNRNEVRQEAIQAAKTRQVSLEYVGV